MRNFILYYLRVPDISSPDGNGSPVFVGDIVDVAAFDADTVTNQIAMIGDMCLESLFTKRPDENCRSADILKLTFSKTCLLDLSV